MKGILSDINIQGQIRALLFVLEGDEWRDVWLSLNLAVFTIPQLGLPATASDAVLWHLCQQEQIVLITGNRNKDGPDSLEATILTSNTPASLPVLTIADTEQVLHSRSYAKRVVERLLEYLIDIDSFRGTGRLYLP